MMSSKKNNVSGLVLSSMFLAIALVLPLLTGQIPEIGNALCPMHLPILLCAFFCGPVRAMSIGFIAPLLRFAIFGMPPIIPKGIGMCFELAAYGLVCGLLYAKLADKKGGVIISLVGAMIAGRIVWGIARAVLYGVGGYEFGWKFFIADGFIKSIPGIIVQLILIPVIVASLKKYTFK